MGEAVCLDSFVLYLFYLTGALFIPIPLRNAYTPRTEMVPVIF